MLPDNILLSGNLTKDLQAFLNQKKYSSLAILLDENTHRDCYPLIVDALPQHFNIEVNSGESEKNIQLQWLTGFSSQSLPAATASPLRRLRRRGGHRPRVDRQAEPAQPLCHRLAAHGAVCRQQAAGAGARARWRQGAALLSEARDARHAQVDPQVPGSGGQ